MRRVIVPVPKKGIHRTPNGAWLSDGDLDYLDDGNTPDPADAVYVAVKDANGTITERVNKIPPGRVHRHQFDGWTPPGQAKKP